MALRCLTVGEALIDFDSFLVKRSRKELTGNDSDCRSAEQDSFTCPLG